MMKIKLFEGAKRQLGFLLLKTKFDKLKQAKTRTNSLSFKLYKMEAEFNVYLFDCLNIR